MYCLPQCLWYFIRYFRKTTKCCSFQVRIKLLFQIELNLCSLKERKHFFSTDVLVNVRTKGEIDPDLTFYIGEWNCDNTASPFLTVLGLQGIPLRSNNYTLTARLLTKDAGTVYLDWVKVEQAPAASRYNLVQNGDFRHTTGWSSKAGLVTKTAAAPELNSKVYKIAGDPAKVKHVSQEVIVSGSAGDTFVLAGWGKADSAPLSAFDTNPREFGLIATFNYTDGTTSTRTVHFNPYVPSKANWQYAAGAIAAVKAYSSITVEFAYDHKCIWRSWGTELPSKPSTANPTSTLRLITSM